MLASVYFDAASKATLPSASAAALGIAAAIAAVDQQDVMGDIQFFTSLPKQQQEGLSQQQSQRQPPQQQPVKSEMQQMFTIETPTATSPSVSQLPSESPGKTNFRTQTCAVSADTVGGLMHCTQLVYF